MGYTAKPAAAVITQSPNEVGLLGYPRESVQLTLVVLGPGGTQEMVHAKRWLVQLGFGSPVLLKVQGRELSLQFANPHGTYGSQVYRTAWVGRRAPECRDFGFPT